MRTLSPSILLILAFLLSGCGDKPSSTLSLPLEPAQLKQNTLAWAEGITPSQGFLERQEEYLHYCAEGSANRGVYGQLCRLETSAGPLNEVPIYDALEEINAREDTADFELNALLRLLTLYADHPDLSPTLKQDIISAVINFKYWLDEPGPDDMCWWSENHQILFHTAELLAGRLFPNTVFPNANMTGEEHVAHALPLIKEWLLYRGQFGFSEWHSHVYFNEDMPALLNLVDFAGDEEVSTLAAMVVDTMAFDFANNYFQGLYATVFGRTYESHLINGFDDSTDEAAYILLGLGTYSSVDNFSGSFLATSPRYWPPALLEAIAADAANSHEHRQRDGVNVLEGPDYGIGYEDFNDIMFYWGMGAYISYPVIDGTFAMVDAYDLWDSYFWKEVAFLQPLSDSPLLTPLSRHLDDFTRGSALESMSTYVYRSPYYQLAGAQNFNFGLWGAQQHMWQATLAPDVVVFTTAPGGMSGDYMSGNWTGGWLPRGLFYRNVGVILYDRDRYPKADEKFFVEYTHAYFPKASFDEVVQTDHWIMGRKGESYIGLYSKNPTAFAAEAPESDYELIADGIQNAWIVELSSASESGSFASFVDALRATPVIVSGNTVNYLSPSQGEVEVTSDAQLFVDGTRINVGPYPRWQNKYATQAYGTRQTEITFAGQRLTLDFVAAQRELTSD